MSIYWSDIAKNIEPYVPGEQPKDKKYIKLNTNENPYSPSPKALKAMKEAANESLRLYPDPSCDELKEVLAKYYNLKKEQVFVGNGSDEVLAFSFMAFFNPDKEILFPDITYTFYPVYAKLFQLNYRSVPLDEDFNVPLQEFYKDNGGVVISNPKAPTAKFLPLDAIKRILDANRDRVVIIDEAYIDFGGESAVKLIDQYPNLLVIQTFSKSRAFAGLRIGYAMGNAELIQGLERVKNSFNSYTLDRLAIIGAVEAVKDDAYFKEITQKIIKTRDKTVQRLSSMGFNVLDSKANFVFASHEKVPAKVLFKELRDRGILVRYFNKPRIDNYLRITMGTDQEMDTVINTLAEILEIQK